MGLVIFTVSGMMPMVLSDFNAMLISRLCLGAGLGMVSPLAVSLITDFYEGEERTAMLGQQFAIGNMGQTASMLIVGILAMISWRQTFWIYSIAAVVLVFVLLFLPKNPPQKGGACMASIAISLIIMGAGNALLMPFGYYHVSKAVPGRSASFSMSVVQAAVSGGSFCSPYIYGAVVKLLGHSSGRFTFVPAACVLALGAAGLLVYGVKSRRCKLGHDGSR